MILTTYSAPRSFPSPALRSFPPFRSFDRAVAQLAGLDTAPAGPAIKGAWVGESYQLTVDLPGVADDSVAVSVAGRVLTIDVTTESSSWNRQFRLPQTLDADQVAARYLNGRLTVTVAKTVEPEARRVSIDTTPAPVVEVAAVEAVDAVEATTSNESAG